MISPPYILIHGLAQWRMCSPSWYHCLHFDYLYIPYPRPLFLLVLHWIVIFVVDFPVIVFGWCWKLIILFWKFIGNRSWFSMLCLPIFFSNPYLWPLLLQMLAGGVLVASTFLIWKFMFFVDSSWNFRVLENLLQFVSMKLQIQVNCLRVLTSALPFLVVWKLIIDTDLICLDHNNCNCQNMVKNWKSDHDYLPPSSMKEYRKQENEAFGKKHDMVQHLPKWAKKQQ